MWDVGPRAQVQKEKVTCVSQTGRGRHRVDDFKWLVEEFPQLDTRSLQSY